jgi:hypothetical protein
MPVDETGMNSVSPSMIPRMMALTQSGTTTLPDSGPERGAIW